MAVSPDGPVRGNPIMLHLQAKRKIPLGRNRRCLVFGPSGGEGFLSALSQTGEHAFDVLDPGGRVLGTIWEEADGLGYFRLSQP